MRGLLLIAKKDLISIREYHPTDQNFILTTWMRGLYEGNDLFAKIKKRIFYENYEKIIKYLLSHPSAVIQVASLVEDPDVILGYAVMERISATKEHRLHWLYVKHLWRRIGIAKDLVKPFNIKTVTHLTKMVEEFKPHRMTFNPFI